MSTQAEPITDAGGAQALDDRWNACIASIGRVTMAQQAARIALRYLSNLRIIGAMPPDRSSATEDLTVLLEWYVESEYVESEVLGDGTVECMRRSADGHFTHWRVDIGRGVDQ